MIVLIFLLTLSFIEWIWEIFGHFIEYGKSYGAVNSRNFVTSARVVKIVTFLFNRIEKLLIDHGSLLIKFFINQTNLT